jgi:hypothetical protein
MALWVVASLVVSPAAAHDLWLQPEEEGSDAARFRIRAVVGAVFPKGEESKPGADYREVRFLRDGPGGPLDADPADPKLLGIATAEGPFFVSAVGPVREIDLKREEVRAYLTEEAGLEPAALRTWLETADPVLRETYARYLKLAVIPAGASRIPADRPAGFPLEVQLVGWTTGHDPRARLVFRVLKDGKPLGGFRVRVLNPGSGSGHVTTGPDGTGEAMVDPSRPTLVAAIDLTRREKARYATVWSNLAVFDLRRSSAK